MSFAEREKQNSDIPLLEILENARLEKAKLMVHRELDEAIKLDPVGGHIKYFNNFHLKLPTGGSTEEVLYRSQLLNIPVKESCGYSPRRASESSSDFFRSVDQAVIDSDIKIKEIKRLEELYRTDPSLFHLTRINILTFKAFVRLRAAGYNHKDLTG